MLPAFCFSSPLSRQGHRFRSVTRWAVPISSHEGAKPRPEAPLRARTAPALGRAPTRWACAGHTSGLCATVRWQLEQRRDVEGSPWHLLSVLCLLHGGQRATSQLTSSIRNGPRSRRDFVFGPHSNFKDIFWWSNSRFVTRNLHQWICLFWIPWSWVRDSSKGQPKARISKMICINR